MQCYFKKSVIDAFALIRIGASTHTILYQIKCSLNNLLKAS